MVNTPGPVNDAIIRLLEKLVAMAEHNNAKTEAAVSLKASIKAANEPIEGVAKEKQQEAQGGIFQYKFPPPAGRETARLVYSILNNMLLEKDWKACKDAFPDFVHKHNPERTTKSSKDVQKWAGRVRHGDSDRGYIDFAVTDALAATLARRINRLTDALDKASSLDAPFSKTVQVIERVGPLLQDKIGKLSMVLAGSKDGPTFKLVVEIADFDVMEIMHDEAEGFKKEMQGLARRSGPSGVPVHYRQTNTPMAPSATYYEIGLDDPKLGQVLSLLDALQKPLGQHWWLGGRD